MNVAVSSAMGNVLAGIGSPDPHVSAMARRSRFISSERTRIFNFACSRKVPGIIDTRFRRCSSALATGRKLGAFVQRTAVKSKKCDPKINPLLAQTHNMVRLNTNNKRLHRQQVVFLYEPGLINARFFNSPSVERLSGAQGERLSDPGEPQ